MGKKWLILLLIAAALLVPPLCILSISAPDIYGVMSSGMCPAAPTDIPPYPCTLGDFLLRIMLGPWEMVGNLVIACSWWLVLGVGVGLYFGIRAVHRHNNPSGVQ